MIIDGRKLSEEIIDELKKERQRFDKLVLGLIVVGSIEDKLGFIKAKEAAAKKLDINFRLYELSENLSREKLRQRISQIVRAKTINGVIIQLPLPEKFKTQYFLNAIVPEKDVDCLSARNLGKFFTDESTVRPPAVEVVDLIKNKFNLNFTSKFAAVVGYGNLVGKPITHYLLKQGATVAVVNSKTSDEVKNDFLAKADIIISGVGKKNLIQVCKDQAVLIDFGYSTDTNMQEFSTNNHQFNTNITGHIRVDSCRDSCKFVFGDVDFEKLKDKASLITPTPGGTGPILVAMLYCNLIKLVSASHRS